jgi:DNA polymerase III subunit epsilon
VKRRILLIDVETTGIDPHRHEIVQLGALLLKGQDLEEHDAFSSLVRPIGPISVGAQKVHGLTIQNLERGPPLECVIREFDARFPADALIAGHNVGFDVAFLKRAYAQVQLTYPFDYHVLDLWSVAFFVLTAQGVTLPTYNLDNLCSLYGVRRDRQHDALADVRASASVMRYLFRGVEARDLKILGQKDLFGD